MLSNNSMSQRRILKGNKNYTEANKHENKHIRMNGQDAAKLLRRKFLAPNANIRKKEKS